MPEAKGEKPSAGSGAPGRQFRETAEASFPAGLLAGAGGWAERFETKYRPLPWRVLRKEMKRGAGMAEQPQIVRTAQKEALL